MSLSSHRTGAHDFGPTVEVRVDGGPGDHEGGFVKPSEVLEYEVAAAQSKLISEMFLVALGRVIDQCSKDPLDIDSLVRLSACFAIGACFAGGVLAGAKSGAACSCLSSLHCQSAHSDCLACAVGR